MILSSVRGISVFCLYIISPWCIFDTTVDLWSLCIIQNLRYASSVEKISYKDWMHDVENIMKEWMCSNCIMLPLQVSLYSLSSCPNSAITFVIYINQVLRLIIHSSLNCVLGTKMCSRLLCIVSLLLLQEWWENDTANLDVK